MEQIKPCPFCGSHPVIEQRIISDPRRREKPAFDISLSWRIRCKQCETEKRALEETHYRITNAGELEIVPLDFSTGEERNPTDGRLEVIKIWNTRAAAEEGDGHEAETGTQRDS